jgi:hypothetical protein
MKVLYALEVLEDGEASSLGGLHALSVVVEL